MSASAEKYRLIADLLDLGTDYNFALNSQYWRLAQELLGQMQQRCRHLELLSMQAEDGTIKPTEETKGTP